MRVLPQRHTRDLRQESTPDTTADHGEALQPLLRRRAKESFVKCLTLRWRQWIGQTFRHPVTLGSYRPWSRPDTHVRWH
jgi:hypothetical protein